MTPSDIVTGTSLSTTTPFVSGRSYSVQLGAPSAEAGRAPTASSVRSAIFRTGHRTTAPCEKLRSLLLVAPVGPAVARQALDQEVARVGHGVGLEALLVVELLGR